MAWMARTHRRPVKDSPSNPLLGVIFFTTAPLAFTTPTSEIKSRKDLHLRHWSSQICLPVDLHCNETQFREDATCLVQHWSRNSSRSSGILTHILSPRCFPERPPLERSSASLSADLTLFGSTALFASISIL